MGQTVHLFEADEICHYLNTLTYKPDLHVPHMPPSFFLATVSRSSCVNTGDSSLIMSPFLQNGAMAVFSANTTFSTQCKVLSSA